MRSYGEAMQLGYRTGTITGMLTDGLGLLGGEFGQLARLGADQKGGLDLVMIGHAAPGAAALDMAVLGQRGIPFGLAVGAAERGRLLPRGAPARA